PIIFYSYMVCFLMASNIKEFKAQHTYGGVVFGERFKLFFIIISQYNPNVFPFKNQSKTFQIYRSITM
ncbi:TPA: hypothetical protein QFF89_000364, partial [Enterococcus faecium]